MLKTGAAPAPFPKQPVLLWAEKVPIILEGAYIVPFLFLRAEQKLLTSELNK